jgi:hypothetical protein
MMLTPNDGVRMITPNGEITYALPEEVNKFHSSGHVVLKDNGYFQIDPLDGETPQDTYARAAKIAKNLPPDVIQKAIDAEKKTWTAKRFAKGAALTTAAFLGYPLLIAGGGEAAAALSAPTVAGTEMVGTGLLDAAGNEIMRESATYGPSILRTIASSPIAQKAAEWIARGAIGGASAWEVKRLLDKWKGTK